MQIWIKNQTYLSDCPESLRTILSARLSLPNLTWIENERMGRWIERYRDRIVEGMCFEKTKIRTHSLTHWRIKVSN